MAFTCSEETIYSMDIDSNFGLNSEKVQALASSVYKEFERMISKYDEDVVKGLLPLTVNILENLDQSLTDFNELKVEQELLQDDNEQLKTQYERERQLRKEADHNLMEIEDAGESASRELRERGDLLEASNRQLEMKCKNFSDQVNRMTERETELSREYNQLHQRHSETLKSYVEHIEKMKSMQQMAISTPDNIRNSPRVNVRPEGFMNALPSPITPVENDPVPSPATPAPDTPQDEIRGHPSPSHNNNISHLSIKDELPLTPKKEPALNNDNGVKSFPEDEENLSFIGNELSSTVETETNEAEGEWVSTKVREILENETDLTYQPENSQDFATGDMDDTAPISGIENAGFEHVANTNESSLFAEMSRQDLGDVDEGADILGMGKEVENLIAENTMLLQTKNALNVVKDDLIQQIDQLNSQLTLLQEELMKSKDDKALLNARISDLEKELRHLQVKFDEKKNEKSNEEEEQIPLSQRKRFTRVEMARVLMERNQYKERLMELQEAVRWTEMLRASREHPDLNPPKNKNKSSIFQFFSKLFNSGNNNTTSTVSPPNNRRRSATASSSSPDISGMTATPSSGRSRSNLTLAQGRSPTMENIHELTPARKFQELKLSESTRMQACGWSLPNLSCVPSEKNRTVPVPVYCKPIFNQSTSTTLWCAAAVSLVVGKTRDGGAVVGTGSVFYPAVSRSRTTGSLSNSCATVFKQNSVDQLNKELEEQKEEIDKELNKQNALSTYVWLVSGDSSGGRSNVESRVRVIDICDPNETLAEFTVGTSESQILCITSVPAGVQEEDYKHTQEVPASSDKPSPSEDVKMNSRSTTNEELAMEATEDSSADTSTQSAGGVTEHVFTDPLGGVHFKSSTAKEIMKSPSSDITMAKSPMYGTLEVVQSPVSESREDVSTENSEMGFTKVIALSPQESRYATMQPTMWMGAQTGCLYVHSAVSNWSHCLCKIRLKDSVLAIVHTHGRVLVALADGTVAIFHRDSDGYWDLSNYHLLDLGRPHHSIRCMAVVYDRVWCGYRNKIRIIDPVAMRIENSFDAHPRRESQVRSLAWAGDGVWVSIRLDSTLRLYHARTYQHLQDVDVEPYVSKVLGTGKVGFSFIRITAMMSSNNRLWIGTGNGVVISVPLSENTTSSKMPAQGPGGVVRIYSDPNSDRVTLGTYIPYCSMANAQLSFHGHKDAVKFFISVPGFAGKNLKVKNANLSQPQLEVNDSLSFGAEPGALIMSGGKGYIDFRKTDGANSPQETANASSNVRSHIIVWQLTPAEKNKNLSS